MELPAISTVEFERFVLVLIRVGSIFVTMPVLGATAIPPVIKTGLTAAVSLALLPVAAPGGLLTQVPLGDLAGLALGELMLGLSMGLLARLFVMAADMGIEVIGFQMGFGIATVVDPSTRSNVSMLGQFQGVITALILLATNAHHFFFRAMAESFRRVPLMGFRPNRGLWELFVEGSSQVFVFALKFAAPMMVVLMLTSVALGIIARTVPQMNIFMVGISLKIVVGFSVLLVSVSLLGLGYSQIFSRMGEVLFRFARVF